MKEKKRNGRIGKKIGIGLILTIAGMLFMASFAVATSNSGNVWAWGDNADGQLGDGTTIQKLTPVQTAGLTNIIAIAGGGDYTIALESDGTVWAWGDNRYGQLGDGTTINRLTPVQVSGLTNIIEIATGRNHNIALKSDGTVWTWGWNSDGQLGDGTTINRLTPVQVSGLTDVIKIAGGDRHAIILKLGGTVWTWGDNSMGQLGDGTATDRLTPIQVSGLANVIKIAGGYVHTIALKSDGTVWTWGWNSDGQLGDGTTINRLTPVQVNGLTDVSEIAGGVSYTIALKSIGTIWAWGWNGGGQLGDGTTINRLTPVQVSGLVNMNEVASRGFHTIALKSDGMVWTWGENTNGQLGDGTTINRLTPVQVGGLTDVIKIAGGYYHTIALSQSFNFAHVTDPHLGYYVIPTGDPGFTSGMEKSVVSFTDILQDTKDKDIDFIVVTGDLVQDRKPEFFMAFKNLARGFTVYATPGNHDRRQLLWENDLTNYREIVNPLNPVQSGEDDWNFSHKGYNFIGLDSGKDFNVIEIPWNLGVFALAWYYRFTPESDGLSESQWNKLNSGEFSQANQRQMIFMHSPVISKNNDVLADDQVYPLQDDAPGGNNEAIANHRGDLIQYAIDNRVDLVLSGHTHEDAIYNAVGNSVDNTSDDRPLFIQTRYGGYRIIKVSDGRVNPFETKTAQEFEKKNFKSSSFWMDRFSIEKYDLHAYDSQGRHTGMIQCSNDFELEIPNSYYTGNYLENSNVPEVLVGYSDMEISNKITEFKVFTRTCSPSSPFGAGVVKSAESQGNITFNQTITDQTDTSTTETVFYNVTIEENSSATINVTNVTAYKMEVDLTSDGIVDQVVIPDSISTISERPQNNISILTYDGNSIINISVDTGNITSAGNMNVSIFPEKQFYEFPHGLIAVSVSDLANGSIVDTTIELPENIPTNSQFWEYGKTAENNISRWYRIPFGSNNGDKVITVRLQDGGIGDDDGIENGIIVTTGGLGITSVPGINGRVIDNITKTGIAGAQVLFSDGNSTITDSLGFYSLSVPEGEYDLTAKLAPVYYMNNTTQVSTFGIAVVEQNIELLKKPTGTISGSVRN